MGAGQRGGQAGGLAAQDVRRHARQHHVVAAEPVGHPVSVSGKHRSAMAEHGALRGPGCTARIGDDIEVPIVEFDPGRNGLVLGQRLLVVKRLPVAETEAQAERDVGPGDDVRQPCVDDGRLRADIGQDVLHLGRLQAVVDRDHHESGLGAAEVHLPVAVARPGQDGHAVPVPQATGMQRGGEPAGPLVGLPPGQVGLGTAVGRVAWSCRGLAAHDLREMHPISLSSRHLPGQAPCRWHII